MKGIYQDPEGFAGNSKFGGVIRESSPFGQFQEAVNEAIGNIQIAASLDRVTHTYKI